MVKVKASWSQPAGFPGMIGRKHVDWSVFESGTTIPREFHDEFAKANEGRLPGPEERQNVTLIFEGKEYPAVLLNNDRKDGAVDRLQLRYDSNRELRDLLQTRLNASYTYLKEKREAESEGGIRKVFIKTDLSQAEYLDFYETGTPFRYRVEIVTAGQTVRTFQQVWDDLKAIIGAGITITTLSQKSTNQLRWRGSDGIEVTAKSADVLPPTMFKDAWDALVASGWLRADDFPGTSRYRNAAVSAILALLPYVDYVAQPKITLFLTTHQFERSEIALLLGSTAHEHVSWAGSLTDPKAAAVVVSEGREGDSHWVDDALDLTATSPTTELGSILHQNQQSAFPLFVFERVGGSAFTYAGRYRVEAEAKHGETYTYRLRPETSEARNWIFQSSPNTYDVTGAVSALPELFWLVKRYRDQIRPGDRVFLWESGRQAGVVAIATVLTEPAPMPLVEDEKTFWRGEINETSSELRVKLKIDRVMAPRIPRQRLVEHEVLRNAQIITLRTGTNFALTPEEAEALMAMIDAPVPEVEPIKDLRVIVSSFSRALQASHIYFGRKHEQLIAAFVAALATKRLVILTGLSGSGKTQIAVRFGEWLGHSADRIRAMLAPVRPDWTGPEPLFGYEDALQKRSTDGRPAWQVPPVLAFLLDAARDPRNPYLLILDEMNLAHVERYFADVLSGMESEQGCLPNLEQEEDGLWRAVPGAARIPFPRNLFVVGTVNVDETTYMFSPKVLDRANVFEFRVEPGDLRTDLQKPVPCEPGDFAHVRGFMAIAEDDQWQVANPPTGLDTYAEHLKTVHHLLYEGGFEFGHRVFYEATRFAAMLQSAGNQDIHHTLDLQIMQKVLPRLHGTRRRLEPVLCALGRFCFELRFDAGTVENGKATEFNLQTRETAQARLKHSFDKVKRMVRSLRTNQFTSFTE